VAFSALWLAGLLLLVFADAAPARACSLALPKFSIEGIAVSVDGSVVTFEVTEVFADADQINPLAIAPLVGTKIRVTYADGEQRFIDDRGFYRVAVYAEPEDAAAIDSGVRQPKDHCGGGGTVHADLSPIDTSLYPTSGFGSSAVISMAVAFAASGVLAAHLSYRRRQQQQREHLEAVAAEIEAGYRPALPGGLSQSGRGEFPRRDYSASESRVMNADRTGADQSPRHRQAEKQRHAFEASDEDGRSRWWKWGFLTLATVALIVWMPAFVAPLPESPVSSGSRCSTGSLPWSERFATSVTVTYSCEGDTPLDPTRTLRLNRTLTGWEVTKYEYTG